MKPTVDPKLDHLRTEAFSHPDGVHRTALLEQAIGRADALGDSRSAWNLRIALMSSAVHHGAIDRVFVALASCVAMSDADALNHPPDDILWQCKWLVADLPELCATPRAVIDGLFDEIERRYAEAGWALRGVLNQRVKAAFALGDTGWRSCSARPATTRG